jgi:hypothetical protein
LWTLLLGAVAWAAVPEGVLPLAVRPDTAERYAAWAKEHGRAEGQLACWRPVPEQVLVCFRLRERGEERWVDTLDLQAWQVDLDGLVAQIKARAATKVEGAGSLKAIGGSQARYWLAAEGTGWESAVWLVPEWYERRLGTSTLLVASPNVGVALAWAGGDADTDEIMAVGVHEMFTNQARPVSEWVFRWLGSRWTVVGRAVPAER